MNRSGGPKHIRELLGRITLARGHAQVTARVELEQVWTEVAGESIAGRTRVGRLQHGVLEVLVDNAALLGELDGFAKHSLLAEIRARVQHNEVKALRFRRL